MNCPGKIVVCFAIVLGIDAGLVTAAEPDPIAPKTLPQPAAGDALTPLMPPLPTAEANPDAGSEPIHDPTSPSPRMRQLIDPPKVQGKTAMEMPVVEVKAADRGGKSGQRGRAADRQTASCRAARQRDRPGRPTTARRFASSNSTRMKSAWKCSL